jgi:DNA-binding CsgD family transcriptional regulator/DNA-binding Lrp family transcriptional regulator
MLEELGISPLEEQVYRAVLSRTATSRSELATATGAATSTVGRALSKLEELGLIRRTDGAYSPAHPDPALNTLIHRRRAGLEKVRGTLGELVDEFRLGNMRAHPSGLIEIVVGPDAIHEIAHMDQLPTTSLMTFDKPPYTMSADQFDEVGQERPLLERGVEVRAIYDTEALQMPGRLATITELIRLGEQARTLPEVPVKLKICDRRVAILMLEGSDEEIAAAAVIQRSSLLDGMIALFDSYWTMARPVLPSHDDAEGDLDEGEALVVAMLGAGLTDQAIARHLDVSLRTARRRIASVIEKVNATSRFQAGAAAAHRGWV